MDTMVFLIQLACLAALACGGWICITEAGKYDADSAKRDEAASLRARTRGLRVTGSESVTSRLAV